MKPKTDTGGFWPPLRAARALNELAYVERALSHAMAGWVSKIANMRLKVEVGLDLHRAIERSDRLRKSMEALTRVDRGKPRVPQGFRNVMMQLDAVPDFVSFVDGVYQVMFPWLLELYREYLVHSDPLADPGARRIIVQVIPEIEAQIDWSGNIAREMGWRMHSTTLLGKIESEWEKREEGPELEWFESLWPPMDRVPVAARPDGIARLETGSMASKPIDALRDPHDIAMMLHSDVDEEFTTLELMARNSYEHPDMPWRFHLDMARQASDEARHALLFLRLLEERGGHYGSFPVNTGSYDNLYQFDACEPGSRRELLWRMLIRQTFMEGLALDGFGSEIARRESAGQPDIACALDYLVRDEVFHTESGLRWSRHLLGDDPRAMLQERHEALKAFTKMIEEQREHFVLANPDKALAELVAIEKTKRAHGGELPKRPLNRTARQEAGFNDDDILQVVSWGYADP